MDSCRTDKVKNEEFECTEYSFQDNEFSGELGNDIFISNNIDDILDNNISDFDSISFDDEFLAKLENDIFDTSNKDFCNLSLNSTASVFEQHIIEDDLVEEDVIEEDIIEEDMELGDFQETKENDIIEEDMELDDLQETKENVKYKQNIKLDKKPIKIVKIPNDGKVGELECTLCKKVFTAQSSLVRHYKTLKHQNNLLENVNNLSQLKVVKQVHKPQKGLISVPLDEARINFNDRVRECRQKLADEKRMITVTHVEQVPQQSVVYQKNKLVTPIPAFIKPVAKVIQLSSSSNATKAAIENSVKLLSKMNSNNSQKENVIESSPKKQINLKQMSLKDMYSKKVVQNTSAKVIEAVPLEKPTRIKIEYVPIAEPATIKIEYDSLQESSTTVENPDFSYNQEAFVKVAEAVPIVEPPTIKKHYDSLLHSFTPVEKQEFSYNQEALKEPFQPYQEPVIGSNQSFMSYKEPKLTNAMIKFKPYQEIVYADIQTDSPYQEQAQSNLNSKVVPSFSEDSSSTDSYSIDSYSIDSNYECQDDQIHYKIFVSTEGILHVNYLTIDQNEVAKMMSENREQQIKSNTGSSSSKMYNCHYCIKSFSSQSNLKRHEHLHEINKQHQCYICGKKFMQKEYLKKHINTH